MNNGGLSKIIKDLIETHKKKGDLVRVDDLGYFVQITIKKGGYLIPKT